MGEVKVTVKLTNAFDEMLARRNTLPSDQIRRYEAEAVIDTGAVRCLLPLHVVQQLGLQMIGQRVAGDADGRMEAVPVTEPFTLSIEFTHQQERLSE